MTTFERFRRDIKSRSNSQVKNSIRRSSQKKDPRVYNLFSFSASQIKFNYDGKTPFSTFKLTITNLTGFRIHFKIRCNNAKNYMVTPFEEVIADQQKIQVKFELALTGLDISSAFKDKFQIVWGKVPYQPNEPTNLTQSKIFPVYIEQYGPTGDDFLKGINNQNFKSSSSLSNKYNSKNYQEIPTSLKSIQLQSYATQPQNTLLSKNNLILVSLVSFILGFIFT